MPPIIVTTDKKGKVKKSKKTSKSILTSDFLFGVNEVCHNVFLGGSYEQQTYSMEEMDEFGNNSTKTMVSVLVLNSIKRRK